MSADLNVVYRKQGVLWKRRRGKHGTTLAKNPNKFQSRLFKLTDDELLYYKVKKHGKHEFKGSYQIKDIKIIERVDDRCGFTKQHSSNCFQIGDGKTDYMYIVASSRDEMNEWIAALRQCVLEKEISLLPQYHPGYLINRKQKKWTCCKKQDVAGCVSSTTGSADVHVCSTSVDSFGSCAKSISWQEETTTSYYSTTSSSTISSISSSSSSTSQSRPGRLNSSTESSSSTLPRGEEPPTDEAADIYLPESPDSRKRRSDSGFRDDSHPSETASTNASIPSFASDSGVRGDTGTHHSKPVITISVSPNPSPKSTRHDSALSNDSGMGTSSLSVNEGVGSESPEGKRKADGKSLLGHDKRNRKKPLTDTRSLPLERLEENCEENDGLIHSGSFKESEYFAPEIRESRDESYASVCVSCTITAVKNAFQESGTLDRFTTGNIYVTSEDDSTPLHNAAKKGDESAMEHLLQQVDFKSNSTMYRDNADETPYDIAWKKGHEGVMKLLKRAMPIPPYTLTKERETLEDGNNTSHPLALVDDSTMLAGESTCVTVLGENMKKRMKSLQLKQPINSLATSDSYILIGYSGVLLADISKFEWETVPVIEAENAAPQLVAFGSNDLFATAEINGTEVQLWTMQKNGLCLSPIHKATLSCQQNKLFSLVAMQTPTNPYITIGVKTPDGECKVLIFDMIKEKHKISFTTGNTGSSHCGPIFTPDGSYLIVPELKKVTKWNLEGHPQPLFGPTFPSEVTALCISPDGEHITIGLMRGGMQVIENKSGKRIFSLGDPNELKPVKSLAYWKNGSFLAASMPGKIQLWSTKPILCKRVSKKPIVAVAFISGSKLVYATDDHYVSVYDTTKSKVLYEIPLQHAIILLDVWNNYVVVSSRTLQLFEIQEKDNMHKLRRIVVMDEEDTTPFTDTSPYLGAFIANGDFATTKTSGHEIAFWSLPPPDKNLITTARARFPLENSVSDYIITRLQGSGDGERIFLAVSIKSTLNGQALTYLLDCRNVSCIKLIDLSQSPLEEIWLSFQQYGRQKIMEICETAVTTVGKCQSLYLPVALADGNIVLYEGPNALSTCKTHEYSEVTALTCIEDNGSTLVAVGYENGKLGIYGRKDEILPNCDEIECVVENQVFYHGNFFQESMLYDKFEFDVDNEGIIFKNYPSYSLKIPKGAVSKGKTIMTGIMKYGMDGPYSLPENIKLVSPVIWLSTDDPDFQFSEPAELVLQHCCKQQESLVLLKADHYGMNKQDFFKFKTVKMVEYTDRCCTSEITHFCIYCVGLEECQPAVVERLRYRLIPINRRGYCNDAYTLILCLTYDLQTCQQAVEEQYPKEEYDVLNHSLWIQPQEDRCEFDVRCPYQTDGQNGWYTTKNPPNTIGLNTLNWQRTFRTRQELRKAHKDCIYPPRFILDFNGKNAEKTTTVTIQLTNATEDLVAFNYPLLNPPTEETGETAAEYHSFKDSTKFSDSGIGLSLNKHHSGPSIHPFVSQASHENRTCGTTTESTETTKCHFTIPD